MRRGLAGSIGRLGLGAMAVVSGAYVLVYLYRWEWHRAQMAGVFFLAAEIGLVGAALLDRMRAVPTRSPAAPGPGSPAPPVREIDDQPEDRAEDARFHFPWLDPMAGRLGVFVPILLGAGLLMSLVAHVVERVSRRMARRATHAGTEQRSSPGRSNRLLVVAGLAFAVLVLGLGLRILADAAQTRNEPPDPYAHLEISFRVRTRGATAPQAAADRLALLCVDPRFTAELVDRHGSAATLVVTPAPGRSDQRKLVGCLEDLQLDRALADVDDTRVVRLPEATS